MEVLGFQLGTKNDHLIDWASRTTLIVIGNFTPREPSTHVFFVHLVMETDIYNMFSGSPTSTSDTVTTFAQPSINSNPIAKLKPYTGQSTFINEHEHGGWDNWEVIELEHFRFSHPSTHCEAERVQKRPRCNFEQTTIQEEHALPRGGRGSQSKCKERWSHTYSCQLAATERLVLWCKQAIGRATMTV